LVVVVGVDWLETDRESSFEWYVPGGGHRPLEAISGKADLTWVGGRTESDPVNPPHVTIALLGGIASVRLDDAYYSETKFRRVRVQFNSFFGAFELSKRSTHDNIKISRCSGAGYIE
jgi:hypothetical protein